jgi:acetyl/propionyl-CoA carboxylase alpha subunit
MISKLVAWGVDRDEAIRRMLRALAEYRIQGPTTNLAFHRWALEHPRFRSGNYDTGFIARHFQAGALGGETATDLPSSAPRSPRCARDVDEPKRRRAASASALALA